MSIKIENVVLPSSDQWKVIIMGCRNPKNSWIRSDSKFNLQTTWESDQDFKIGPNDLKLMSTLCNAGTDHRKFMRMIPVYLDIIAPLYFLERIFDLQGGHRCKLMFNYAQDSGEGIYS